MGKKGKYIVEVVLGFMQIGVVITMIYFALVSLRGVIDDVFEVETKTIYIGTKIRF